MRLTREDVLKQIEARSLDFRGADLSGANLIGADLSGANLIGANLIGADLSGADMRWANLREAKLHRADLSVAELIGADLIGAELIGSNLTGTDLYGAELTGANLFGADLRGADLRGTNLSGATGLLDPAEWIKETFEVDSEYVYAYKAFGRWHQPPKQWTIESGSVISENVDPDRTNDCSYGINVSTLGWCRHNTKGQPFWKVRIKMIDLINSVVPYNTDGRFRVGRCELMEIVT